MYKSNYLNNLLNDVKAKYSNEPEFLAAVEEFAHGTKYRAIGRNVEVPILHFQQAFLKHVFRQEHGREHRTLRLRILRHLPCMVQRRPGRVYLNLGFGHLPLPCACLPVVHPFYKKQMSKGAKLFLPKSF